MAILEEELAKVREERKHLLAKNVQLTVRMRDQEEQVEKLTNENEQTRGDDDSKNEIISELRERNIILETRLKHESEKAESLTAESERHTMIAKRDKTLTHEMIQRQKTEVDRLRSNNKFELARVQEEVNRLNREKQDVMRSLREKQQLVVGLETDVRERDEEVKRLSDAEQVNKTLIKKLEGETSRYRRRSLKEEKKKEKMEMALELESAAFDNFHKRWGSKSKTSVAEVTQPLEGVLAKKGTLVGWRKRYMA